MEKYFLSCITENTIKKNLKKQRGKSDSISAWSEAFVDIKFGRLSELTLFNYFKDIIRDDGTHLEAFKAVVKIFSAFNLAVNQTTMSNHLSKLVPKVGGYNRNELADVLGCSRPELSELLNDLGLSKRVRKENFNAQEATEIRYLLDAYKNRKERVEAYKSMKKKKNLHALTEDDLILEKSKKLRSLNSKTGIFTS